MSSVTSRSLQSFYNHADGVCEAAPIAPEPEAPMCVATETASLGRRPSIISAQRYHASLQQHLLTRTVSIDPSQLAAGASSNSQASVQANPLTHSVLGLGVGTMFTLPGCSNSTEELPPSDVEPEMPPSEDPDPIPGEQDGVGAITPDHASGNCLNPADIMLSHVNNSVLMVCGDDPTVDGGEGVGVIEVVDPGASGPATALAVPTMIAGDAGRLVRLSSGVTQEGSSLIVAGLSPAGNQADFESNPSIFANSGILAMSQTGGVPDSNDVVEFDQLDFTFPIPLANVPGSAEQPVVSSIQPNTPVSMTILGDTLYVLNANMAYNQQAALEGLDVLDYAPPTIHAYTIGDSGTLTPKAIFEEPTEPAFEFALPLIGQFAPAAINTTPDGNLAVLIRGIGGGDNPSKILVINPENPAESQEISITDSAGLNFWAGPSNEMPIVDFNGSPHALVGAGDGTGRLAMVNLDDGSTSYVGVFSGETNVVSVVVDTSGTQLVAVSDTGSIRTVNLGEIDEISGLPKVGEIHSIPAEPRLAALRGNSMIVAHPTSYTQVEVTTPEPAGE